jgi:hypothetical protein
VITVAPFCPAVSVTAPQAAAGPAGSYTLSVTPAGGSGFLYRWIETSPTLHQIGTDPSVVVTPLVTSTYYVQVTNSCGNYRDSQTVTITPCRPPVITQPADQTIMGPGTTTIEVIATGSGELHYQWFRGTAGDSTVPVGTDAPQFTTPHLNADAGYWVKVTNACGTASSGTITVTVVRPKRRAS